GDELVDFLAHRLHDLLLGYLPDHVAVLEDEADSPSSGTPDSGCRSPPGPLAPPPLPAMWISSLSPLNSSSTSFASFTRSTSARPQEGHETKVRPPLRSPSDFRMSIPTRTSSVGSAESDTRIVSPMPSERSAPSPIADL